MKTVEHQNGGGYSLTSNDRNYITGLSIHQIVVDSNEVHIAFADPQNGGTTLLASRDGGASFLHEDTYPRDKVLLLVYRNGNRLAIGEQGAYPGRAISAWRIAMPGEKIAHAGAGEADGKIYAYATTVKGDVFVSEDNGVSWQMKTPALGQQSGQFGAIAAASGNGRIAYIGFRGLKLGEGPENIYNGIAKTLDAGKSWFIVFRESTRTASNLDVSWIEERAVGTDWDGYKSIIFDAPYSLGVAPGNPDIRYATDLFRTYRTQDGGKSGRR